MEKQYDVIVVGTGPAGATVAAQMAKTGQKVLMVEKGAYHPTWLLGKQLPALCTSTSWGFWPRRRG